MASEDDEESLPCVLSLFQSPCPPKCRNNVYGVLKTKFVPADLPGPTAAILITLTSLLIPRDH